MIIKVSDYIASFLADNGIEHVFTVTGGGAMHLNDALGHCERLKCIYNHHEQASAIAAEAYARVNNKIAAVCVTTGPGGTNALTGVVGGWLDSIPMLIISGQVRFDTTARSTGLPLRAMGDQEFDITKAVCSMTKYCEMVTEPEKIRYCLEKALYLAQTGRPGPCWLDIPMNIQSAKIDTDKLTAFVPETKIKKDLSADINTIIEKLKISEYPVIYAGNGIRISGCYDEFDELVHKLSIPVVTGWNSIDLMQSDDPLYIGRGGIMGDRAGNFAVQKSDFILSLGSRLSIRQVGYNYKTWAKDAYVAMVDIDENELRKPTLHVDLPICADVKDVINELNCAISENEFDFSSWIDFCNGLKNKYPVVQEKHFENGDTNVYAFIKQLSDSLPEGFITVVGNGSASVVGSQVYTIKEGQRFIINSAIASMGYDLPAAIGVCIANGKNKIVCLTGDGSLQMNIQELQTIIHHKLPIKLFVINNGGYHSIRQTQKNYFGEPLVGIGVDSFDLSFPDLEKLAFAYGYKYCSIKTNEQTLETIEKVMDGDEPIICEVFVTHDQNFEPKASSKILADGTMVSPSLEDLFPFLPKEEIDEIMNSKP